MTYSLPFGLTQKPMNHYFNGGVIKFNVREGVLHYTIKKISKTSNATLFKGIIRNKEHLNKLMDAKTLHEIQTIEVVN